MREMMVDGNVRGENLEEVIESRVDFFIKKNNISREKYFELTVPEFFKIKNIQNDEEINLWFEDDLFCQVNFWFVVNLLLEQKKDNPIFLIRPKLGCEYSFGRMNQDELEDVFSKKIKIERSQVNQFSNLWKAYQNGDAKALLNISKMMNENFPFLKNAVQAHSDRLNFDRPKRTLIQIINELKTDDFGSILKEFTKRESIYGFGDLQVKRILDEIKSGN